MPKAQRTNRITAMVKSIVLNLLISTGCYAGSWPFSVVRSSVCLPHRESRPPAALRHVTEYGQQRRIEGLADGIIENCDSRLPLVPAKLLSSQIAAVRGSTAPRRTMHAL